jgi:hypothetical protein
MKKQKPFILRGADGRTIAIAAGDYYFNTKACCRRMMLDSLTSHARQVYACLELHAKGYRREICLITENGKIRRLTVRDIVRLTKLDAGTVRRALRELEAAGLAERRLVDATKPIVKGNVAIYCHAVPKAAAPQKEGARALNSIPTWFPADAGEWRSLKAFLKRSRVSIDPQIEGTRDLLLEGEEVARDLDKAESRARAYADRLRAQARTPAHIEERSERNKPKRNGASAAATTTAAAGAAAAAAPEPLIAIAPVLEAFAPIDGITDSKARRLIDDCAGASAKEIAAKASELIPGIQRNPRAHNPVAILVSELVKFFADSPAACAMWRRDRQAAADAEEARNRRAAERRAQLEAEFGEKL